MAVGPGSVMGYSGAVAPVPTLSRLPEDWWDPAWQAAQSPGATGLGPAIFSPGEALAPAAGPQTRLAAPPPSWGQVLATTFRLWAARHLPWLRRFPRRLLAASALGAGLVAVAVGTAGVAVAVLSPRPPRAAREAGAHSRPVRPDRAAGLAGDDCCGPRRPAGLSIPAIGVRTSLMDLGLN